MYSPGSLHAGALGGRFGSRFARRFRRSGRFRDGQFSAFGQRQRGQKGGRVGMLGQCVRALFGGYGDLAGIFAPAHAALRETAGVFVRVLGDAHGQLRRGGEQEQTVRDRAVKAQLAEVRAFQGEGLADGLDLIGQVQAGQVREGGERAGLDFVRVCNKALQAGEVERIGGDLLHMASEIQALQRVVLSKA